MRFERIHFRLIQYTAIFVCFLLALSSSWRKSATVDETAIVANGYVLLKTGDYSIDSRTAPLPKIISALPLLFADVAYDFSKPLQYKTCWECANNFQYSNAAAFHSLIMLSRLPSILILCVACLLTILLARRLYGDKAAAVSAIFVSFSPVLLAYGSLATSDIYFTASFMGLFLVIDVYVQKPNLFHAALAGVLLGVCCLCKFTGVLLLPLIPLLLIPVFIVIRNTRQIAIHLGAIYLVCLMLIHAGFGFEKSLMVIGEYAFESNLFKKVFGMLPSLLPSPFPRYFLEGMDSQLAEEGYTSYLLGEFNTSGFPHYYIVALLVKTSLPLLFVAAISVVQRVLPGKREIPVAVTCLALLAYLSFAGHKNIGVRYILFLYPAMCLLAARIVYLAGTILREDRRRVMTVLPVIAAGLLVIETCFAWPDYIPYFNQLAGGGRNGHNWLLDSNLDWGQDLTTLKEYMDANRIDKIDLACYGRVSPGIYGINYDHLFQGRRNRYAAISANLLWGNMYFINCTDVWPQDRNIFAEFRKISPCAILGHSIYVFDLGDVPGKK